MRGTILCLMVALAGCTLRANRQASLPPPPKPEAVKPAPEPPLSIPQTSASLPSPQELNPDAIPKEPPEERATPEKAGAPPATRTTPHRAAAPPVKPPDTTPGPPEAEEPAAATPAATEPPPPLFQPIMSQEQQNQLKAAIATRKHEINSLLAKAVEHPGNDQTLIDHIKSNLKLAEEAEQRSDFTQADDLSKRALNLAQELKVE